MEAEAVMAKEAATRTEMKVNMLRVESKGAKNYAIFTLLLFTLGFEGEKPVDHAIAIVYDEMGNAR